MLELGTGCLFKILRSKVGYYVNDRNIFQKSRQPTTSNKLCRVWSISTVRTSSIGISNPKIYWLWRECWNCQILAGQHIRQLSNDWDNLVRDRHFVGHWTTCRLRSLRGTTTIKRWISGVSEYSAISWPQVEHHFKCQMTSKAPMVKYCQSN